MHRLLSSMVIFLWSQAVLCTPVFDLVPLGVYGGLQDGNLSAYLLKTDASDNYIALDGGTLVHGLEVAVNRDAVGNQTVGSLLQKHIPAYLISHAHLDHLMGLVLAQPELRAQQTIMARAETMQAVQKHIFNWSVWGNFGDGGEQPHLNYQHYQTVPLREWVAIPHTNLQVKTFPLSHSGMASSAFLIRYQNEYLLYFGDTGADRIEKSTNMESIWHEIAPLIKKKQLHAIMLECSFLNSQPDDKLFGHLKPDLFLLELQRLALLVEPRNFKNALQGLAVVVTHIKPELTASGYVSEDRREQILQELSRDNELGIKLIKPEQGVRLSL